MRTFEFDAQHLPLSRTVNACNARRTFFILSSASASIKLPSLSNLAGGWNAFKKNSGLLMKWRSRYTPICLKWYWARPPPKPPPVLIIAAALSAQTFGGRDAQSTAFFKGAGNKRKSCSKILKSTSDNCSTLEWSLPKPSKFIPWPNYTQDLWRINEAW